MLPDDRGRQQPLLRSALRYLSAYKAGFGAKSHKYLAKTIIKKRYFSLAKDNSVSRYSKYKESVSPKRQIQSICYKKKPDIHS